MAAAKKTEAAEEGGGRSRGAFANLGASRGGNVSYMDPWKVTIPGRDTKHDCKPGGGGKNPHWAWEERASYTPDPDMVEIAAEIGILEPVVLVKDGDQAIPEDGRQRTIILRAANELREKKGLEPLPLPFITSKKGGEGDTSWRGLIANYHRREDGPMVEARQIHYFKEILKYPYEKIAKGMVKDPKTVRVLHSLMQCSPKLQKAVEKGFSFEAAAAMSKMSNEEQDAEYDRMAAEGELTTSDAKRRTKRVAAEKAGDTEAAEANSYKVPSKGILKKIIEQEKGREKPLLDPIVLKVLRVLAGKLNPKNVKGLVKAIEATQPKPVVEEEEATEEEVVEEEEVEEDGEE